MIRRRIPIEHNLYNRAVTFLFGTLEEINTFLSRLDSPTKHRPLEVGCRGHYTVRLTRSGHEADFICLVREPGQLVRPKKYTPYLSHEVLHHTFHVMFRAGMKPGHKSEEAYTYYHQWILTRCLEFMP